MRVYYANTVCFLDWLLCMADILQSVLFVVCTLNELFFIALYLLSFSSSWFMPSVQLEGGETGAASSEIWSSPFSAGAMEMAR